MGRVSQGGRLCQRYLVTLLPHFRALTTSTQTEIQSLPRYPRLPSRISGSTRSLLRLKAKRLSMEPNSPHGTTPRSTFSSRRPSLSPQNFPRHRNRTLKILVCDRRLLIELSWSPARSINDSLLWSMIGTCSTSSSIPLALG